VASRNVPPKHSPIVNELAQLANSAVNTPFRTEHMELPLPVATNGRRCRARRVEVQALLVFEEPKPRGIYQVRPDSDAAAAGYIRVIANPGEGDYTYMARRAALRVSTCDGCETVESAWVAADGHRPLRRLRNLMSNPEAIKCLLISAAILIANAVVTTQPRTLAITGVNVVEIANGRIAPNSTITIRDQMISSVAQDGALPEGAQSVNGQGKFLIPGLWDMHAHIQGNEKAWLPLYIANGVTGIRDMGADLDFILEVRDATASGRTLGPRIVAAGPILDDAPGDWPLRIRVRNPDEGRAAVQLLKRRGVDLIKVHNFTPRDVFFAIVDEARRQQLPVAGHVPLKVTIQEGIDAGMVTIEHMSEDGRVWKACSGGAQYRPDACRPFFEMLASRRVWQTPTLIALSELAAIGTPASSISREQLA
jgi:hypothetical protein